MSTKSLTLILLLILPLCYSQAQTDSILQQLQKIPTKYLDQTEKKVDKYSNRITSKTEKTLVKLSRWENKIHSLLQKANPEAANRLFAQNQMTFTIALQKYREGKAVTEGYKAKYDQYCDEMATRIKYLENKKDLLDKKYLKPLAATKEKLTALENDIQNTEAMQKFIKERRKQLLQEAMKYLGKSKYLNKINKESYYYVETLRNYKELFNDKKKAEQTAIAILNNIPVFQKFLKENSVLSSLFNLPANYASSQSIGGLQTRASMQAFMQSGPISSGPNAQQAILQNFQRGQAELGQLKDKVLKAGGTNSDSEVPDFKPNEQKTKTFLQRLELGSNLQFSKPNGYIPNTADIGLSIGYKLNDKSIIGLGASYKMGVGSLNRLSITHQGLGVRSFIDWKLKKQFFVSGGFEMNYIASFKNIEQLQNYNDWQQSGLVGLTKKLKIKSKRLKGSKIQLLYDILYREHNPVSQPIIFRTGYNF